MRRSQRCPARAPGRVPDVPVPCPGTRAGRRDSTGVARLPSTSGRPGIPDRLPLGRDSVYWKVNSEPAIFTGGGRALLMQVAHPGVGAGVEQHSSYERDPWGRLFRTMDIMMKLSFGTPEESARQQRVMTAMHRKVKGSTDLGDPYSAFDVDLQVWVWATLVDTALVVYERVRPRLSDHQRERYYQESKLMAYGCGVPEGACPRPLHRLP